MVESIILEISKNNLRIIDFLRNRFIEVWAMYRVKFRKRVVLGEEEMLRRLNKAINQVLRDPQDYHVKDAHRLEY